MSTMVEQRAQPLGGYENYETMRYGTSPQFSNPWGSSSGSRQLYNQHHSSPAPNESYNAQQYSTDNSKSLRSGDSNTQSQSYTGDYTTSASTSTPSYVATAPANQFPNVQYPSQYESYEQRYAQYQQQQQEHTRKQSFEMKPPLAGRNSFNDALDGAQGMVAMSQQDFTPRSAYAPRNNSGDSYGFPSSQSDQDSVTSGSSYPYYGSYNGSIDGSVGSSATDYSTSSDDVGQRTLPPPGQLINGFPAEANQMMTQFNSKLAASAQKKHKCKICDKRFTRPSSLQTHMYSHTGEKPFSCDFEGCGRHFSVVSNLRRHKKCHKGSSVGDAESTGSPEPMESED